MLHCLYVCPTRRTFYSRWCCVCLQEIRSPGLDVFGWHACQTRGRPAYRGGHDDWQACTARGERRAEQGMQFHNSVHYLASLISRLATNASVLLPMQAQQAVLLPTFYSEDTPASANETWARLHSDPLFAVSPSSLFGNSEDQHLPCDCLANTNMLMVPCDSGRTNMQQGCV